MAPAKNGFERERRMRKALAVATHIWAGLPADDRTDAQTPWRFQKAHPSLRAKFAEAAGQKPQSDEGWQLTVELLSALVNAERGGAKTQPCERCEDGARERGDRLNDSGYSEAYATACECLEMDNLEPCENCAEEPGAVVVPLGLYCPSCAAEDYPDLAPRALAGAA